MRALSIRQPWAYLIINGGKDIENRDWPTKVRGTVLVHAAKGMTIDEYDDAADYALRNGVIIPPRKKYYRGGIIGTVDIIDCVEKSSSPWFMGKYGFVLANPKPLPFVPYRGALGFFWILDEIAGVA